MKLITLLFVIVIPISGVVSQLLCSFPGIPLNAAAYSNEYEKITWENRRSFSPGEHVTFHCMEDGVPDDKDYEIICRNNGTWNRLPPVCRSTNRRCGWPPVPAHGDVTRNITAIEGAVSYECKNFAELVGNSMNHCNDVHWQPAPQCLCPLPENSLIDKVTIVNFADKISSFKCKYGLERVGPEQAVCNATIGDWNELPKCFCPLPKVPKHIALKKMNETAAAFRCQGLSTGNGTITCNIGYDGINWTSPICHCILPEPIANGYYIKLTESNLQFKCNFAYQLIGAEYATCNHEDYVWTELPRCEFSTTSIVCIVVSIVVFLIIVCAIGLIAWCRKVRRKNNCC